ncbi:hypothetical protein [uncultured Mobiluncus sp.]|uniref:hypothetical protein n=1 Tax=uncultured Mobiluncus sp. TaxID=293425 RepID=UPI0027D9387B|nr:hypothetical protein [uncultured Mobiluncus sp.]
MQLDFREVIVMADVLPWSFTIEFDPEKAARNGYDVDALYECVDENVQRYGLTRLARGTWKANEDNRVESQCMSLLMLSDQKWVMQNVRSITAYERGTDPIDIIASLKKSNPELVYA